MKPFYLVATLCAIAGMTACQKTNTNHSTANAGNDTAAVVNTNNTNTDSTTSVPFPQNLASTSPYCPAMSIYADSVIYPQPNSGQDFTLLPVNNPGAGTYYAWPAGMIINQTTGAIDLTLSQSGQKYMIGFVPNGTKDTCMSTLIIGGASYLDSAYVVSNGSPVAAPYFDANTSGGSNCDGQGDGSGCKFDVTGTAMLQGVFVNPSNGKIDLNKTLNGEGSKNGVFGVAPFDGETVNATIYYMLKHGSNNALQNIQIQFIYYSRLSDVPAALLSNINSKLTNAIDGGLISTSLNPRPPLVLIVRAI